MDRKTIGDDAEHDACCYLQDRGLQLLCKNFRCRGGEIDLIMRHGDSLVFVEVRYRRHLGFGRAAETVSTVKQGRIIRCAQFYIHRFGYWNAPARFDVVCIEGADKHRQIDWITDAFQVEV